MLIWILPILFFLNETRALVSLIPKPNQMVVNESAPGFVITGSTRILVQANRPDLDEVGQYLRDLLIVQIPDLAPVASHPGGVQPVGSILLTTVGANHDLGAEGYQLDSDQSRVTIAALDRRGAFYGVQTLRQLLPAAIESADPVTGTWSIPQVGIDDKPAVSYRAFMLDVSRTFFPKEFLLRQIDLMALHKNNVLHLHLTDDQGWRMESLVYPALHELGAFWDETAVPQYGDGYYTQQELAEIIQYAAERNIQIIPEIDLPAHSLALMHALPELACNQPRESNEFIILPWAQWGVSSHEPICPAPESNYDILDAILGEVAALFPSAYIHVGTDEVQIFDAWNSSAEVAALETQEGLSDNSQVQAYFAKRLEDIVTAHGKTLVAWSEARFHSNALPPSLSEFRLDPDSVTMYWTDHGSNNQMFLFPYILTPRIYLYYDFVGNGETETQYNFDPIAYVEARLGRPPTAFERANLWGIQGSMWTHTEPFRNEASVDQYVYPSHCATSEVAWTEAVNRNYGDFTTRLQAHSQRLGILSDRYYGTSLGGLVGHWPCDEGTGNVLHDASGQMAPGELIGGVSWVPGTLGTALALDGVNDYVEMGYAQNLPNWTAALWVKSPAAPAAGAASGPLHRDQNFVIGWNHGNSAFRGAAALSVGGTWYAASFGSLQANIWYHLAATYDGENLRAYKNGVLITDNSLPSGVPDSEPNSLKIARHSDAAQFFQGVVDEVRIYNRALTGAEIHAVFEGDVDPCAGGGACGDGNICTDDSCDPATGCVHTANALPCSDSNACTTADTCNGGVCTGSAVACGDGNACTNDSCNPASGCVHTALSCGDGNVCTNDSCNPASGCVFSPNTASCNDGNACTTGDTCSAGSCTPGSALVCNDGNSNTQDSCNPATGCVFTPVGGAPGLIGSWACDEGSGSQVYSSGSGPSGQLLGGVAWVSGHTGTALSFDGSNDYVDLGYTQQLGTWTLAAWMKSPLAPGAGPASGPIHRDRNFAIGWNHSNAAFRGAAALSVGGTWYSASFGSLAGQTWYHLAATYDGENLRTYKNGVLVTNNALPSGPPDLESASMKFGRHAAAAQYFSGVVDDVQLYNRALTAAEIQSVFNGQTGGACGANGTPCNDGNACTTGDTCNGGVCTGGAALACGDANACTSDSCNPASGCVHSPVSGSCNDGNACTTGDTCSGGVCTGGAALACGDGNSCTSDSCNPASGCVHSPVSGTCNDSNACTTGDICSGGVCTGGAPLACGDGNSCTSDSCNPSFGCLHSPVSGSCSDGNACTTGDTCSGGVCTGGAPLACGDGNACTTDSCNPASGCVHTALNCGDSNSCTSDSCNPASGCVNAPVSGSCNDGNACTTGDTCSGGVCAGGAPLACGDGNSCTSDSCNPASGCVHSPVSGSCNDGNVCTTGDTCSGGVCSGGAPLACGDGNACTTDSCNPASGCVHTTLNCGDGNSCTSDSCNPASGCVFSPVSGSCNDGNACTTGDTCSGGVCTGGAPLACGDGNVCTSDSCNPASGCVFSPVSGSCNDGNACTTGDTCSSGVCTGGPALTCGDSNICTNDSCNPASGCVFSPNTASCNDGNACTTADTCGGGACNGGPPLVCNDGNPNTNDTCVPSTGCVFTDAALLRDLFEDGVMTWTVTEGQWFEAGGKLQNVFVPSAGATVFAPLPWPSGASGCSLCTIETELETTGGNGTHVRLFGWYQNDSNYVVVIMNEASDRWTLGQQAGSVSNLLTRNRSIQPNVAYDVRFDFDGTDFHLWVDDALLITLRAVGPPTGNVGARTSRTTVKIGSVYVH